MFSTKPLYLNSTKEATFLKCLHMSSCAPSLTKQKTTTYFYRLFYIKFYPSSTLPTKKDMLADRDSRQHPRQTVRVLLLQRNSGFNSVRTTALKCSVQTPPFTTTNTTSPPKSPRCGCPPRCGGRGQLTLREEGSVSGTCYFHLQLQIFALML